MRRQWNERGKDKKMGPWSVQLSVAPGREKVRESRSLDVLTRRIILLIHSVCEG